MICIYCGWEDLDILAYDDERDLMHYSCNNCHLCFNDLTSIAWEDDEQECFEYCTCPSCKEISE